MANLKLINLNMNFKTVNLIGVNFNLYRYIPKLHRLVLNQSTVRAQLYVTSYKNVGFGRRSHHVPHLRLYERRGASKCLMMAVVQALRFYIYRVLYFVVE